MDKQIIVVLGMHRSGTSAITRGLKVLGVELGSHLLSAEAGINDKGFWEDVDVTAFNVDLLEALGHDWHTLTPILPEELHSPIVDEYRLRAVQILRSKLSDLDCFGVKDPRMARLLPFWQEIFVELDLKVSYVIAFRNPKSVAHSLAKRNGFELEKGYFLWLEHMLMSLKYSHGASRVFVSYDLMLQEPENQLKRISLALGLPFDPQGSDFQEYKHQFLQYSLQHNKFALEELSHDPTVPADVLTLSTFLLALSNDSRAADQQLERLIEELYRAMLERLPAYRLMRHFDDHSRDLAGQVVVKDQSISMLEADRSVLVVNLSALEADHDALAANRSVLEEHLSKLQSNLAESERAIKSLETDLRRYDSGRFLLRTLAGRVLERLGFRYRGDDLSKSELFDGSYYLNTYDDVRVVGKNPLKHYLEQGWREGRNPSAGFSTQAYLDLYEDVRLRGINPLVHYLRHGYYEGRVIYDASGTLYQFSRQPSRNRKVIDLLRLVVQQPELLSRFVREVRRGGVRHALAITTKKLQMSQKRSIRGENSRALNGESSTEYDVLRVVPYYLDPYLQEFAFAKPKKVAIHLYLCDMSLEDTYVDYLNNIPVEFDLYLSVPAGRDTAFNSEAFRRAVPLLHKLVVENVPSWVGHIVPFITQFGSRLTGYDYIGHFHTKEDTSLVSSSSCPNVLMDLLCGSKNSVSQIFNLLDGDAKVVYPACNQTEVATRSDVSFGDAGGVVRDTFQKYSYFETFELPDNGLPRCSMFWAKTESLSDFLGLPLEYKDFPSEREDFAGTMLNHCLERLVLVCTTQSDGRNYRLESPQLSRESLEYYEEQQDYSNTIVHDSIKVLAYYLPQFHPTPENDEWHGEGFTEWYKVRAANPLYYGHYQQHVPHADIGYYHLDSPDQLALQAQLMQKSGVHGLIYYHYWFSGDLILEKPAKMLLENPQIDMPFCFCWANENWTRRWDGNEQEILLGQVYSKEDAGAFIRYLIPFFKDERYIKVDGRPVLFVYRPSSMEHVDDYMTIWREECELNGVKAPYVVATLTRGATSPQDYGMEAAVERVLQDWTGGAVPDISSEQRPYWPLNGSILDYSAVADHYMEKILDNDYPLFRSLVPTWDNTARYGANAYVLKDFTTAKFQSWVEYLIEYSEQNLPADRRFLVVNAWNEWAEGAHLEPDTRFGYGYLNSIGRALSDYSFLATDYIAINRDLMLKVVIEPAALARLQTEPETRRKFLVCLANSSVFERCTIVIEDAKLGGELRALGAMLSNEDNASANLTLVFSDLCLFPVQTIESMVKMALRHKGSYVSASMRNDPACLQSEGTVNFEIDQAQRGSMELRLANPATGYKVCCDAPCFRLAPEKNVVDAGVDKVSTIVRFHRRGDRQMLVNALLSIMAQVGCQVTPYLAIQDMTDDEVNELEVQLDRLPWSNNYRPVIRRYFSTAETPDLRSLMLNDTLRAIGSGYTAFLDYDDVLFPGAYSSLLERLKANGKNATFARVYSTMVDASTGCIVKRDKVYDYGDSYIDFVRHNHAPLHSFMLDLDRCDLSSVIYFDDMKYMEDYYLTLQLFTRDDTDWASLRTCGFIGDYIHRIGCDNHTLAITDEQRVELLNSESYRVCEARIKELRNRLDVEG